MSKKTVRASTNEEKSDNLNSVRNSIKEECNTDQSEKRAKVKPHWESKLRHEIKTHWEPFVKNAVSEMLVTGIPPPVHIGRLKNGRPIPIDNATLKAIKNGQEKDVTYCGTYRLSATQSKE